MVSDDCQPVHLYSVAAALVEGLNLTVGVGSDVAAAGGGGAAAPAPAPALTGLLQGATGKYIHPSFTNRPCALDALGGFKCPSEWSCVETSDSINMGYTSFDNFVWACMLIFQV